MPVCSYVRHDTGYIPSDCYGWGIHSFAQTVQVGAIGGFSATDPNAFSTGESKRYMIGPSVEGRFFARRSDLSWTRSTAGSAIRTPATSALPRPIIKGRHRSRAFTSDRAATRGRCL